MARRTRATPMRLRGPFLELGMQLLCRTGGLRWLDPGSASVGRTDMGVASGRFGMPTFTSRFTTVAVNSTRTFTRFTRKKHVAEVLYLTKKSRMQR